MADYCRVCGEESSLTSRALGVCASCIREKTEEALPPIAEAHKIARYEYGLPPQPPKHPAGIPCNLCANECRMGPGEKGFCGLRENVVGLLRSRATPEKGFLYTYLDPQVTNCCSAWFCPAGTGVGYPRYAYKDGPETGYYNLAVFFYGCNFDCLFCQNTSHKELWRGGTVSLGSFAKRARSRRVSCVCYFGGSPEPQLPFAVEASKRIIEENPDRILRICFEWNGCGNPELVRKAAELALTSGGNLKFDLKCFNPAMSLALSGVPNTRAYENFRMVAEEFFEKRREIPVLTATTLLVPGYVDVQEVESIAKFIASLSDEIPYSLLVFSPHFKMADLPITPIRQVRECYATAKKYLKRVHVGNLHLLALAGLSSIAHY